MGRSSDRQPNYTECEPRRPVGERIDDDIRHQGSEARNETKTEPDQHEASPHALTLARRPLILGDHA
jgi:hypothetical protein